MLAGREDFGHYPTFFAAGRRLAGAAALQSAACRGETLFQAKAVFMGFGPAGGGFATTRPVRAAGLRFGIGSKRGAIRLSGGTALRCDVPPRAIATPWQQGNRWIIYPAALRETIGCMRMFCWAALALLALPQAVAAQTTGSNDPIIVSTEHPRLFLRPARLRLLRRERERNSLRWEQFQTLMAGHAAMPEPGFALALYYQIAGDKEAGRSALAWALGPAADLRQMSIVFDWCYDLMSDGEKQKLAARVAQSMSAAPANQAIHEMSARTLAAVALFDETPDVPQRELQRVVQWWGASILAPIQAGANPIRRDDAYAVYELLHAIQDNVKVDLRENAPGFFKDFPIEHLLSYYPAPLQAPENDYYIGAEKSVGEPDLRLAALSRAAELAMVAYDPNAPDTQVLQGWLMHDKYLMRGAFGAPYEFLWANPYQPGLSYYHVPLVFYAPERGRLFVRSSWEDSAQWFGAFDGVLQSFNNGAVQALNPRAAAKMDLTEAMICFGGGDWKEKFSFSEPEAVFVVGLEPKHTYKIEIDDEEMYEASSDEAGILELDDVPAGRAAGVRISR